MKNEKKLRLIISSYDDKKNPYYGGGGAISIHEVAKRLVKNYSIVVLTGKYPGSKNEVIDNVSYERLGHTLLGPRLGQLIFQLFLPFYAIRKKYDLWIESFTPPFSTAFLPLFTKKPIIGLVQLLSGKDKSRQYKLPFYLVEELGLKGYKNFIVPTHDVFNKINFVNSKSKIEIIPNGIDPELMNIKTKMKDKNYILYIGRIEIEQKGLDILIRAYKKISDKITSKLIIAGSGTKKDEKVVKTLAKKLHLENRIEFFGRVDGKKKIDLLKNSMLMVIPSRFESFGIVALEGFASRSPVIAFDIDGLKWIPKNCSIKIYPFDENKYAKAIEKLSNDYKLRQSLAEVSYTFVKKFNWDSSAKKYNRFIKKIYETHI